MIKSGITMYLVPPDSFNQEEKQHINYESLTSCCWIQTYGKITNLMTGLCHWMSHSDSTPATDRSPDLLGEIWGLP